MKDVNNPTSPDFEQNFFTSIVTSSLPSRPLPIMQEPQDGFTCLPAQNAIHGWVPACCALWWARIHASVALPVSAPVIAGLSAGLPSDS